MCLIIGTPKTINFPVGTNGKLMVLGVPILKHFRVIMLKAITINVISKACHGKKVCMCRRGDANKL